MRGRKPLPTKLKKIKGTLEKSRILKDEMQTPLVSEMPEPPDWLDEIGVKEWNRVAKILHGVRILSPADLTILAMYCNEISVYINAEKQLKANTRFIVYKDDKGKIKHSQQIALQGVANKALDKALRIAAEFGLTPSARTRIGTGDVSERDPIGELAKRKIS